jgi:hypothetical protein
MRGLLSVSESVLLSVLTHGLNQQASTRPLTESLVRLQVKCYRPLLSEEGLHELSSETSLLIIPRYEQLRETLRFDLALLGALDPRLLFVVVGTRLRRLKAQQELRNTTPE